MEKKKKIHYWYLIVPVLIFICGCLTGLLPDFIGSLAYLFFYLLVFISPFPFIGLFCVRWSCKAPKKQLIVDGLCAVMAIVAFNNLNNMRKYHYLIRDYNKVNSYLKEKFGNSYHIKGYSYYKTDKRVNNSSCDFTFEVYLDDSPKETFKVGYCAYFNGPFTEYGISTTYKQKE